jgi:hypothetical protein
MPTATENITITESNAATGGPVEVSLSGTAGGTRGGTRPPGMPLFVRAAQLYYWSFAWQDSERKAMADLRAGRSRTFDDPGAAVRYLLGSDR